VDAAGIERQPIMLHRVLLGSLERFIGALLEHYNAELPLWLAPVQAVVIPIKDTLGEYAGDLKRQLERHALRVEVDAGNETLNKRIRNAELNKVPYILVVGEREAKAGSVAVRKKGGGDLGVVPVEEFVKKVTEEITGKC
jgi:threonyl-tRNA synthetase